MATALVRPATTMRGSGLAATAAFTAFFLPFAAHATPRRVPVNGRLPVIDSESETDSEA